MTNTTSLLYFADPMCSWCWGFAPVVASLVKHVGDGVPVSVIAGGLAPDDVRPMDPTTADTIRTHWGHVREASGQPFNYALLEWQNFIYNTEPSCRALVTSRRLDPQASLGFLTQLHTAFYRDNIDITDEQTLCDLAADFGFDRETFEQELTSVEMHKATRTDFALGRELGVTGFPSLIGRFERQLQIIMIGYRPWPQIRTIVDAWLHDCARHNDTT